MTAEIFLNIIFVIVASLLFYFSLTMHHNRVKHIREKSNNRAEIRRRVNLESDTQYGIVAGIGLLLTALESFANAIKNQFIAIPLKVLVWIGLILTLVMIGIEIYNRIQNKRKEQNDERYISNRDSSDFSGNDNYLNDEKESHD